MPTASRPFDFLVVGANRCGTTSLWRALDSHPQVRVPSNKEREFFSSDERYARGLDHYVARTFPGLRDDEVFGTVTPQLMAPDPAALATIVERIRATSPDVKLMALLRDPIDRAVSQFRRMKKIGGGGEEETFDAFVERVAARRGGEIGKIPLVRASDYGRILTPYFEAFGPERIRVFFTADLDRDPRGVHRQVFAFLGVDAEHDAGSPRIHLGGLDQRVSEEALQELLDELDRLGLLPPDDNVRVGLGWWLRHVWNCEPDRRGTEVSDDLRARLAERYAADGEVLQRLLGVEPPWLGALRARA